MKQFYLLLSKFLFTILAFGAVIVIPGCSQDDSQPPPGMTITDIKLAVDKSTFSGTCPHSYQYTAKFTASTAGTVSYLWERTNGQNSDVKTLTIPSTLQADATDTYAVTATGTLGVRIRVLQPVTFTSSSLAVTTICTNP